jgi:hypothetical protein
MGLEANAALNWGQFTHLWKGELLVCSQGVNIAVVFTRSPAANSIAANVRAQGHCVTCLRNQARIRKWLQMP